MNFNNNLKRKDKILILNEIFNNGINPLLFQKTSTYVFIQDLINHNLFKMGDKYYDEKEVNKFENDINKINAYLIEKLHFKYDDLNKVLIVLFKEGKSIL